MIDDCIQSRTLITMFVQPPTRYSECHPDKKHYARGLCRKCYDKRPERLEKIRANQKHWLQKHPDGNRHAWMKHFYGVTVEKFNQLLSEQEGACAICQNSFSKPCIDHDHKSRKVRGLLCRNCNVGLGLFSDDVKLLHHAITYLTKSTEVET